MPDDATVAQLKAEINRLLSIPAEDMALSKDPKLVRPPPLSPQSAALSRLAVDRQGLLRCMAAMLYERFYLMDDRL